MTRLLQSQTGKTLCRIEAIACWCMGDLIGGWIGRAWFVLGFLALWDFWGWRARRAA